jgi:LysM repeat protein
VYRIVVLGVVLVVAASCGGGGASPGGFGQKPTATNTPSQQVLGARSEATQSPSPTAASRTEYIVADGDTLSEIAARFGTTTEALVTLNALADADALQVGQVIRLSGAAPTPTVPSTAAASSPTASE